MKFNKDNYASNVANIDILALPTELQKGHGFVVDATENFSDWSIYKEDDAVKKTIDLYFDKLSQYLEKMPSIPKSRDREVKAHKAKSEPKTKRQKTRSAIPKPNKKNKAPSQSAKRVEHIAEEVKYVKRFVSLHNKVKSKSSILSLIKSIQRSIVQKFIRKTSPLASEIRMIQDKLVNAYNKTREDELRIMINETDLPRLMSIAGGEEVYPSIRIIKRYVGLQGRRIETKTIESFSKQIGNAIKNKKVAETDPYYDRVKAIHNSVKRMIDGTILKIGQMELNGLNGIISGCNCNSNLGRIYKTGNKILRRCKRGTYSDSKGNGTCSHNNGMGDIPEGVKTAEEIANMEFDELDFQSPWKELFGKPEKNFKMMFHGDPHTGKTILLLKFAEYLAKNFGTVLYISSEEYESKTLSTKIKILIPNPPATLHFVGDLRKADLSLYDFVFLDSLTDLGLKLKDCKQLAEDYPQIGFVFMLQHNKNGEYRGEKGLEHYIQVAAHLSQKGVVSVYRNRYGVYGTLNFFDYFGTTPEQFAI